MKKTFRLLGLALVAILFSVSLSACSSDDDDKVNTNDYTSTDTALVGKWVKAEVGSNWSDTETYEFKSDGTYEETDVEVKAGQTYTTWEKGTWKTNSQKNQVLRVVTSSSDPSEVGDQDVDYYTVQSGVLTLDNDVYLKVTNE